MKILLIDNYDSFTYNLYHYLSSLKCKVEVHRNDKIKVDKIDYSIGDKYHEQYYHEVNQFLDIKKEPSEN